MRLPFVLFLSLVNRESYLLALAVAFMSPTCDPKAQTFAPGQTFVSPRKKWKEEKSETAKCTSESSDRTKPLFNEL